jgi:hypothetical protein
MGDGGMKMGATQIEDIWQRQATEVAIAAARKVVAGGSLPAMIPVARLNDAQWGWIVCAAITGWIRVRVEQAIAEKLDDEQLVRTINSKPQPADVAAIESILPLLSEQPGLDWSQPLTAWSREQMTEFLLLARRLVDQAEIAANQGKILRPSKAEFDDPVPFFDERDSS